LRRTSILISGVAIVVAFVVSLWPVEVKTLP